MPPRTKMWKLDPHTRAKHIILRVYLDGWLPAIIHGAERRVLVIDGFSGPGEYVNEDGTPGDDGSPVIALNALMNHTGIDLAGTRKEFVFVFLDEKADRSSHLETVAIPTRVGKVPDNVRIIVKNKEFAPTVTEILDDLADKGTRLAPSLVFVDPFGWSGVPMSLMQRLLSQPKSEVLVTFMVDSVNRWLTHSDVKIQAHLDELFGCSDWRMIATGAQRYDKLRELYERQLMGGIQHRFVRSFRMWNEAGKPVYDLVFGTNHIEGLKKMKAAMWKVDPRKGGSFSDRAAKRPTLFDVAPEVEPLDEILIAKFAGKSATVERVERFVVVETDFRETHYKKRLKKLEEDGKVVCIDRPDKKRKKGTYPPGTEIKFL